jgi:hypothetical protein
MKDLGQHLLRRVQISISGFYIQSICFDKQNNVTLHIVLKVENETFKALVNTNFDRLHKIIWSLADTTLAEKIILRLCDEIQGEQSPCILEMSEISNQKVYIDNAELHTFLTKTRPVYVYEEQDAFNMTLFGKQPTATVEAEVPVFCLMELSVKTK